MKFIITEEEKKYIKSLYEQLTTGQTTSQRIIKGTKGEYDATNRSNQDLQAIVDEIGRRFIAYYNGEKVNPRDTDDFCGDGEGNGPLSSKFKLVGDNNCITLVTNLISFVIDNNPDLSKQPFNLKRPQIPLSENLLETLKKNTYSLPQLLNYIGDPKNKKILEKELSTPDFSNFFQHSNNIYKNKMGVFVSLPDEFVKSLENLKQNKFEITGKQDGLYYASSINNEQTLMYEYGNFNGKFSIKEYK